MTKPGIFTSSKPGIVGMGIRLRDSTRPAMASSTSTPSPVFAPSNRSRSICLDVRLALNLGRPAIFMLADPSREYAFPSGPCFILSSGIIMSRVVACNVPSIKSGNCPSSISFCSRLRLSSNLPSNSGPEFLNAMMPSRNTPGSDFLFGLMRVFRTTSPSTRIPVESEIAASTSS